MTLASEKVLEDLAQISFGLLSAGYRTTLDRMLFLGHVDEPSVAVQLPVLVPHPT